jgi:hypothetical protein
MNSFEESIIDMNEYYRTAKDTILFYHIVITFD